MKKKKIFSSYKRSLIIIFIFALGATVFMYFHKTAHSEVTIGGDVYSGGNLENITVENMAAYLVNEFAKHLKSYPLKKLTITVYEYPWQSATATKVFTKT